MVFSKHNAGKGEDAVNSCSISLSHPIIPSEPSYSGCLLTLTEVTQIWGTQKRFLNTISQLVLLTCTVAGEYLPDTLYSMVKLTSYCKNLHERVGLAVGWLRKLKQREAGPPQYCPAAFAPLPIHTGSCLFTSWWVTQFTSSLTVWLNFGNPIKDKLTIYFYGMKRKQKDLIRA